MAKYIAFLHKEAGSDFGVSFPDFPGCVTAGRNLQQAGNLAEEALAFHIKGLREDGEVIPAPSSLDEVIADAKDIAAVLIVEVPEKPTKVVRVNVTFSEDDLREIDRRAEAAGASRSAFLARAALSSRGDLAKAKRRVARRSPRPEKLAVRKAARKKAT